MRVLVIDDDEQMRILLRQMVEWLGHDALVAVDGREGIKLLKEFDTTLVITDLIMPEQEGLETIRIINREFPGIKVIAVSGGGRIGPEAYLPAAKELGADRVFSKPFEIEQLAEAVKELIDDAA